jgi:tripartite-type tricarboxylate transporter receptor subunit TctC
MASRIAACVLGLTMALGAMPTANADPVEDFYRSHPVTMILGYSAGGTFDIFARTVGTYMQRYIPGRPTMVVQNMPGAGSLTATNYVYNISPKDGSVIAMVRAPVFEPLTGTNASAFDATKFTWIGNGLQELVVCAVLGNPQIKSAADATRISFTLAGSGPGSDDDMFSKALIKLLGFKGRLISGYPGGNEMNMAVQTGEVDGRCGWSWSGVLDMPDWQKVRPLVALTFKRSPELPDTPTIMEMATTERQKQILTVLVSAEVLGRPFLAPPNVPADRAAALRKAFDAAMKDPGLIADLTARHEAPTPNDWREVETLVKNLFATPKDVLEEAKALIN